MKLHGGLALSKLRPRKQRQAQIDDGGVQSVGGLIELYRERIVLMKLSGVSDQHLGKILVDSPVAHFVGVRQSVARNLAADAHMIELFARRSQAGLDVPETFAKGELSKAH